MFINLTLADTLPTVNMESIACGTPVITYDTGGSPELVEQDKTGYIVDVFDYKAIIKAIDSIKQNRNYSLVCRSFAEELFDKNMKYREYIDLYSKKASR